MPQITNLNPTAEVDVNTGIVTAPNIDLLSLFGPSQEVTDLSETGPNRDGLLENGDGVTVTAGGAERSGTYVGDATITTTQASLVIPSLVPLAPALLRLTVQVNPIQGEIISYDNGDLAFISDEPLSDFRFGVTATLSLSGVNIPLPANIDLADLDAVLRAIPAVGPLLGSTLNLTQFVADTAIISVAVNTEGTLVVCFAAGTMILTKHGEVPIETLAVGDRIFTRDHSLQTIRWIGRRALSARVLNANPNLRPIRIKAGALGEGLPSADLVVSPQHRILIGSRIAERMFASHEILVAAKQLLALDGVEVAMDVEQVDYFHILLDRHEVIFAHGLGTESLYTGPQALKSMSMAAQMELFALFPDLMKQDQETPSARPLAPGRKARQLVDRHVKNLRPIMSRRTCRDLSEHFDLIEAQIKWDPKSVKP